MIASAWLAARSLLFVIEFNQLIEWVMGSCPFSFNDEIEFNERKHCFNESMHEERHLIEFEFMK